jgi:DNA-binding NtrC family response regulator
MNASPANTKAHSSQQEKTEATILLVEDEPVVREVTRAVLEHAGYRVLESNGSEEALRLGIEHRGHIGLLLSDVVMPGMNGPELALRLQSLQPGLITVFMSGYADHDVLHRVMHGAMTAFIQKPFTIEVLLSGVAEALRTPPKVSEAARLSGVSAGRLQCMR